MEVLDAADGIGGLTGEGSLQQRLKMERRARAAGGCQSPTEVDLMSGTARALCYDASIDVARIVPERPVPQWILERSGRKGRSRKQVGSSSRSLSPGQSQPYARYSRYEREPVRRWLGKDVPVSRSSLRTSSAGVGLAQHMPTPALEEVDDTLQGASDPPSGYLRLDLSKLPLEMFDSPEFEALDKSPDEWVARGAARVPYFSGGQWGWARCAVTSYDDETRTYVVQLQMPHVAEGENGEPGRIRALEKRIRRFNILFDGEDEERWKLRRAAAESARNDAKGRLRFDHFIAQQSPDEICSMRETTLQSIHERLLDGVPNSMKSLLADEDASPVAERLAELRNEVASAHARESKKNVLFAKLFFNDAARAEYRRLKLPEPPAKGEPAPWLGKVAIPRHSFQEHRRAVQNIHFSSMPEVLGAFVWLHVVWHTVFDKSSFADVQMTGLQRPCELDDFVARQMKSCDRLGERLAQDWSRSFAEQLVDSIQDIYDLFQTDAKIYKSSALRHLLKHLELRMRFQLKDLTLSSVSEWRNFISQEASGSSSLGPERPPEPLFRVSLLVSGGSADDGTPGGITMEPSATSIRDACTGVVSRMLERLRDITTIDAELLSLLHLPQRLLLEPDTLEEYVNESIEAIEAAVVTAMEGPLELAASYEDHSYLLDLSPAEVTEELSSLTPDDYFAEVRRYHEAGEAIMRCSTDCVTFSLTLVDTRDVKKVLSERAFAIRDALLKSMIARAREQNHSIAERYKAVLARVSEKPTNEVELKSLNDYIEVALKEMVKVLVDEVHSLHVRLDLLDGFCFALGEEDAKLSWRVLEFPAEVEAAVARVTAALEVDKIRMMDQLAREKEKFEEIWERFEVDVMRAKERSDYAASEANTDYVNSIQEAIREANARADDFNARERVFGFPPTEYRILKRVEEELAPFYKLWNMISDFAASRKEWLHGPFLELKSDDIERDVTDWWKTSYKMSKQLTEEHPGPAACASKLREETDEFRQNLPVIQALASPALKPRHWEQLSEKIGSTVEPDEELTLQQLLDANIGEHIELIQEVCVAAEKEYGLEKLLESMREEWRVVDFEVKPYKESGTFLVAGVDEIITLLDDHIVKTQTMRGSPYIRPIEARCKDWEMRLKYAQGLIDEWMTCQRTWLYLEPIFSSEDIMRQLPTEARRFAAVDALWRKTMEDTSKDANFIAQADPERMLEEKFKAANQKLEEIQKGLTDYLEMKRLYFPRFFFLSNDELLEILSQTKEPRAVQPHLNKAFEGISKCNFASDNKITDVISAEGEVIKLDCAVDPESAGNKGNVERWLLDLEKMQWQSVRTYSQRGLADYTERPREEWALCWPAQVVLAVSQVFWTQDVSRAIADGSLPELEKSLNSQLKAITMQVRGKLTSLERKTLGALCTIDVHARDVVSTLAAAGVSSEGDFDWMSQLRYYWSPSWKDGQAVKKGEDTFVVRIVNARCLYGYEYLGNTMRLVITPLTDRCYRTMIGAIDLLYGGAPEGPAGTGKTETVKDLSKAVAIQCVVFNCSDGLDYLAMAKFFKGLAGCGSWCCFDEFNRINIEVLSVIAQQILTINKAKRTGQDKFHFEGTFMKINHNANAFITMNPGYAGRAELPDNLKALFRPCAMMVPDYSLIAEIRLYSFGFEHARENAQKLVRVLQLSSEQLSSQKHYDYGMRAVNSILVAAGNLRQALGGDPEWTEAKIVLRSVNDVNLPKFTVEDLPLFRGITSDLFPGVELGGSNHGSLQGNILKACESRKLQPKDSWISKVIQLYEMVLVRHGVMIVGSTGSGKTSAVRVLSDALGAQVHTMNPKAITSGQLYGNFDENTHEWNDGILAVIYRNCAKDQSQGRKWLVFDGPVDAVWIENMNTVLDDNKKLCLMSGEIIKMSDSMTMMFEAEDLEQASPATVSRVGMIYCEIRNLGWEPLREKWLDGLGELQTDQRKVIESLFDWLFPPAEFFVQRHCHIPTPVTGQELAASLIRILDSNIEMIGDADRLSAALQGIFVTSLVWSVGACVDAAGRGRFNEYLLGLMTGSATTLEGSAHIDFCVKNPGWKKPEPTARITNLPPETSSGCSLYDHRFVASECHWIPWLDGNSSFSIPEGSEFQTIVVPTLDTVRHESLLELLITHGHHVLCTGDTGTGKSVSVKTKLSKGMSESYSNMMLNFSAQTSANQTQDTIDSKLDKRRKGVLGPPLGVNCIVFVDDLNMPAKEEYGAQPPIELLRQWMDHGGWYDRKDNSFRQLVDIQFIAAMGPPGGGRTRITQRYVRHFNVLNFVQFSNESLNRVFGTVLNWWFLGGGFNEGVQQIGANVVGATVEVYNRIAESLLPTPMKSHYTFNLRDLSKVFQGMLQGNSANITEAPQLISLWAHECLRVFSDRLVSSEDRSFFADILREATDKFFPNQGKEITVGSNLMYGSFMKDGAPAGGNYELVDDYAALSKRMEDFLEDHNAVAHRPMSLVLFKNAIEHVARISRIISLPSGNALLVGVGGSGRKSLTTLAVSIADYKLFQIEISKSYGMAEWHDDLRTVLKMAGAQDTPTVFLLDDTQIVREAFLEDVNGILNTGEVANLFNAEEMAEVTESVSRAAQAADLPPYAYFIRRVQKNLHVVLCLSPIGDAFRTRLRMFPSLVNCCTIDWFTAWPEEALTSVAKHFLDPVDLDEEVRSAVVEVCVDMQTSVSAMTASYLTEMGRHYYVTPTSYLELLNTFKNILQRERHAVLDRKERYDHGLLKLSDTEAQVATMQRELEELQPKLKEATVATDALLVQIAADTKVANENKVVVEKDEKICAGQAAEANKLKTDCEADLAEAIPALESAVAALKSLSKADIVEVKAMKKPPQAVKMVLEAVCIMMDVQPVKIKPPDGAAGQKKIDDYWGPAQKHLLGNARFLQNLMEYEKDSMDPAMVARVKQNYTDDPDFDPEKVKKGSVAAAGLCKWVHAMVLYDRVARVVGPKRIALAQAEKDLAEAEATLEAKRATLKELLDKLEALQEQLRAAEAKKLALQEQVTDCSNKLRRAQQLISGLGGEKANWSKASADLLRRYQNVTGDMMLSSGVIAYMGAFTATYRERALQQWSAKLSLRQIPHAPDFKLSTVLGEPVKIRSWTIAKLPNDSFSIDNAIMMTESNRWPLMIDPQGQANKFVKKLEEANSIKVVKQTQATFVRTVENAIQFGSPILIENVGESLDPVLSSVLLKQIVTVGGVPTIRLGDNSVEYDAKFRLYMTTTLPNPHYPPELCVKVNLLNFMATEEGLQDQMLGITVAREEAELEARREQLVLEDAENRRAQEDIENTILTLLKNSKGNILEDETLIDTLAQSKVMSNNIERKVKEAAKTQAVIAKTRRGYEPVAFRASQLFFCIAGLGAVDPMYQYSLEWFIGLFEMAMAKAESSTVLADRLSNLNQVFTMTLYRNVCRSLFEKDKLLFSFLLAVKIMKGDGKMDPGELRFFLQGSTGLGAPDGVQPALPHSSLSSWLPEKSWSELCSFDVSKDIESSLRKFPDKWKSAFQSAAPYSAISSLLPNQTPFQNLCVLRALRPDAVVPAVMDFVSQEMGSAFIEPPPFDLMECYKDSTCSTPLIFVLTPGADPMTELLKVAEELGFGGKRLASISLGQGQGPLAENAITEAADSGTWVCLQNCHLCISWMPVLERICEELSPDRIHPDFRLWLTSEPSPHFPTFILQNGVKMTNEPPRGLRANILGSFLGVDEEWYETCRNPHAFKKLVFGLCFFHATVSERRKFGPLGWNIQYVFSGPDLRISMDQLRIFLDGSEDEKGTEIPFRALAYLAGECNYGGRVTDDKDRRLLVNILSDFYCPNILEDGHKMSPSGMYYAPPTSENLAGVLKYIRSLPHSEAPEIFGLHDNANISCALAETNTLLDAALRLEGAGTGAGGGSASDSLGELAHSIAQRMPPPFDIEKALIDFPVSYEESMNTVLTQELVRFNDLTDVITCSLDAIGKAIKGLVVMSSELEDLGNSMVLGRVPAAWQAAAYPSLKPLGPWVADLLQRLSTLRAWMEAGRPPSIFWISGFFFTQAFITGTLQNYARRHGLPIDQVGFDFRVLTDAESGDAESSPPTDGAYVRGLFIEGATWNKKKHAIDESAPRQLLVPMPYIHILPRARQDVPVVRGDPSLGTGSTEGKAHVYMCPVYKTALRQGTLSTTGHSTNFVMFMNLPMAREHEQKHWIKRGVAMLTEGDD
jgi:dynein heavy chain